LPKHFKSRSREQGAGAEQKQKLKELETRNVKLLFICV